MANKSGATCVASTPRETAAEALQQGHPCGVCRERSLEKKVQLHDEPPCLTQQLVVTHGP